MYPKNAAEDTSLEHFRYEGLKYGFTRPDIRWGERWQDRITVYVAHPALTILRVQTQPQTTGEQM